MAVFQKKQKASAPTLSKDALLNSKREAMQDSQKKLASLEENHASLLQQKAGLELEHHNALIAAGFDETGAGATLSALESQIEQTQRRIAAVDAARGHQQAIHAELSREVNALQEELSRQKHREYMADLETRVREKKEQLIAHLYGGCGLLAELVKLAEEAYMADERSALQGNTTVNYAGHRFVQEALEDLNLRTTPIIMMERAGFAPVRSSLAFAHRAYEVRALLPPETVTHSINDDHGARAERAF
jgi:chromosome segregation ATPase